VAKPRLTSDEFGAQVRAPPRWPSLRLSAHSFRYALAALRLSRAAYPFRNFASFGATTAAQ
jgi:hypothetical protein